MAKAAPDLPPTMRLLTEKQMAQLLGLHPQVMRRCRREGVLFASIPHPPFIRMGRNIRYSPVATLRHIQQYADEGASQVQELLNVAFPPTPDELGAVERLFATTEKGKLPDS